jgi:hypothetical protein
LVSISVGAAEMANKTKGTPQKVDAIQRVGPEKFVDHLRAAILRSSGPITSP